ncbi:CGAS synthase, partial [Atractosteus spatula]|nr:CGAS synthase [Atractosteus spatula]
MDFLKDNKEQPYFRDVTKLTTGSYYEMVKIHNPNEFDVMLLLPTPRLELTELHGFSGFFYQLAVVRAPRTPLGAFLLPDGRGISATRILQDTRSLVKTFLRTYRALCPSGRWLMDRKRASCPAVTLTLHSPEAAEPISLDIVPTLEVSAAQSWPGATRGGLCVQDWLGKKARRHFISQALYFVPKQPPGRQRGEDTKECWRISFSHIEKEIFKNHGSSKTCCESYAKSCCRKKALRLLKCLIEGLKQRHPRELARLCSYHGKTVFLHTLSRHGDDALWAPRRLPSCFLLLLDSFIAHVQRAELPHFFISASNMFAPAAFPRRSLLFLQGALLEQRQSGVPLFQVSSPSRLLPVDPPGPSAAPSCPPVRSSGLHFPSLPWGLGALALLTTLLFAAALVLH